MRVTTAHRAFALLPIAGTAFAIAACADGSPSYAAPTATTAAPRATTVPSPTTEPVTTLLFTGDVIPARCTYAKLRDLGSYDAAFDGVRSILGLADITIGTLDSTLADSAEPIGCTETFNLAGPAEFAGALGGAGFDVISHAANHIKDCGNAACGDLAVTETIANLRRNGIAAVGSGSNIDAARAPVIIERNGVRFAFLAYDDIAPYYHATTTAAGAAPLDLSTLADDIAAARAQAEVVVVLPQWGVEYTASPTDRQRVAAWGMAFAGAHLVVGNHAHWVAAHEQVGDVFVAYALGNFVFDQDWSIETQQGAMLEVTFTGTRLTSTRYIPIHIHDEYQPRLADPAEATAILDRIEAASRTLPAR
jgi:poly-gamma-glutamate synthesis protein (capsule biosynthesis protein)